jgi:phage protein U
MTGVMLILGGYPFLLDGTPYQDFARQTGWDWPEQSLIGSPPAMQFNGRQAEKITVRGTLVPGFTAGREALAALRLLGDQGLPLPLIGGNGYFFGLWVIESLEEGQDVHFADGSPRRMTFSVGLKKYADTIVSLTGAVDKLKQLPRLF